MQVNGQEVELRMRTEVPQEPVIAGYLEGEAEGAIPNGERIVKVEAEDGDGTDVGIGGVVLSSFYVGDTDQSEIPGRHVEYFYFVRYDDFPYPVGVIDWKIAKEA